LVDIAYDKSKELGIRRAAGSCGVRFRRLVATQGVGSYAPWRCSLQL